MLNTFLAVPKFLRSLAAFKSVRSRIREFKGSGGKATMLFAISEVSGGGTSNHWPTHSISLSTPLRHTALNRLRSSCPSRTEGLLYVYPISKTPTAMDSQMVESARTVSHMIPAQGHKSVLTGLRTLFEPKCAHS